MALNRLRAQKLLNADLNLPIVSSRSKQRWVRYFDVVFCLSVNFCRTIDVFMACHKEIFRSFCAFTGESSQVYGNDCRPLDRLARRTSRNHNTRTHVNSSLNLLCTVTRTERQVGHPVPVGSCCSLRRESFSLLVSVLILLLPSDSGALRLSFRPETQKDIIYTTNASENAERRQGIDSSLRKYSFMALSQATPGNVYNATLPPYFDGITAQAIQLSYGSLKNHGLIFNEFTIPVGAVVTGGPVVVLIYRKIFNFSVYSLPTEYDFAGPVVGVVAYAITNISLDDTPIPETSFTSPDSSIVVHLPTFKSIGSRVPLCAFFNVDGTLVLRNVSSLPNVCTSGTLGDVSLVLSATRAPPSVHHPPSTETPTMKRPPAKRKPSNSWKFAFIATIGAIAGLGILGGLAIFGRGVVERVRIAEMECVVNHEVPLQTALIGQIIAPTAPGTRTCPSLETEKFVAGAS